MAFTTQKYGVSQERKRNEYDNFIYFGAKKNPSSSWDFESSLVMTFEEYRSQNPV